MLLKITKINESKCIVTKFQMKCIISTAVHRFITVGPENAPIQIILSA